ncbi:Tn3 family transposase [Actinomadura sediminis]|uniref:Tn3 family transposase n=1 Tax=Actinomadura sediminis TaxID=1038904 RepID=A0ABW3ELK4_9ACTN
MLARYAFGSKAPLLERTAEPKRTALLTALMRHLEAKAIDEAMDLFQVLMATRLISTARRATDKDRLSTPPQLEKASRTPARAAMVLFEELEPVEELDADVDVAALWAAVEEVAPREAVMSAAAMVVSPVPQDEGSAEVAMRAALAGRYNTVKPFLALLGESKAPDAATGGARVLAGVRGLPAPPRRKVSVKPGLPRRDGGQLGALGLALNAVVLWTTRYIDAAVQHLRPEGHELRDEDIARLSPLKHRNLDIPGCYSFTASVPRKGLRAPARTGRVGVGRRRDRHGVNSPGRGNHLGG